MNARRQEPKENGGNPVGDVPHRIPASGLAAKDVPRLPLSRPAGVRCAVLMPHAPILVPEVGCKRGHAAKASSHALREVAACVLRHQPETVVVISPHSPRKPGTFGIWADDRLQGSFEQFGAPEASVSLPNNFPLAKTLATEAQNRALITWEIRQHSLDHGALVPLWFLSEAGWAGPTVVLSLNHPEDGGLIELGEAIAAAAQTLRHRIAIVASGDMSHRLTTNAPCGFHPRAHQFDETFIQLLREGDYHGLEQINPELRELAAEDAVDSTLIAAAAVAWNTTGHEVLSYEGPFGVGYGVAILFAEGPAVADTETMRGKSVHSEGKCLPGLAREAVAAALRGSYEFPPPSTGDYLSQPRGVFVTVRDRSGNLRGCTGTITPSCENVVAETWRSARLAALHDGRFEPVTADELPHLRFSVSVLHSLEKISTTDELDPERYGVVVSAEDGRRGLLLPDIEDITNSDQQVRLAQQKAWIAPHEPVTLQRFQVDYFEEQNA